MPPVSSLIITSFVIVLLAVALMIINTFLDDKYRGLTIIHYYLGGVAGLIYLAAALTVFLDKRPWSPFKMELLILLVIFLLVYGSAYLGKYKKQRLLHYLMVFVLMVMIVIMHLKWSGVI
jgi:hypothetical protein